MVCYAFFYGSIIGEYSVGFPYPSYFPRHRERIIIGIEVGIGQGLAAGGDWGVIGGAGGGNFGEGNVYGNGGILVVLRIGLIIISNCYSYRNGFTYAQAFSQLISNGAIRFKHAPASSQAAFGRISSRVETQRSCILCQFVQICTNVIIDIDGLAGGVIVDLVHIDGAQLGAIRFGNGNLDIPAGEGVGANGSCTAVIVVPRVQAGFHCIGLGGSIINRGFLAAVYLVPLVGHTGRIIRGNNGCGKNRGLFGGVAIFGVVMVRYGCRDTLDGGFLNSITIKYIAGAQQGVLISDSGNFAVGAAGEFYFGAGGNFQLSNGAIPHYGKPALCYFQFIYG